MFARRWFLLVALVLAGALAHGCGGGALGGGDYYGGGSGSPGGGGYEGDYGEAGRAPSSGADDDEAPEEPPEPVPLPEYGLLTAGYWDDNLDHDLFLDYVSGVRQADELLPTLRSDELVVISVVDERGRPVSNAGVSVRDAGERELFAGPTGTDGRTLFLPRHDGGSGESTLSVTVSPPEGSAEVAAWQGPAPEGDAWTITLPGVTAQPTQALDLAFVVDTTGSMSDEMHYLAAEIRGIVDEVRATHAEASLRFALVVYRDRGDEYVVRGFDFTENLEDFADDLAAQTAAGGGDTPEAMEEALQAMHELSWRRGDVARVAFLVADAPPHRENAEEMLAQVDLARRAGIRVYPVAASGVMDDAEYLLRVAAQVTLARYIFLTDDSGVGLPHAEPHIPCYTVQPLSVVLRVMLLSELEGKRLDVDPAEVIRTEGNPHEGRCLPDEGEGEPA